MAQSACVFVKEELIPPHGLRSRAAGTMCCGMDTVQESVPAAIETLSDDFAVLDEWEDRYRYIIELGRTLPPLDESERVPRNKVQGCASQVWIATHVKSDNGEAVMSFAGDSDALIVKGLIAILFMLYAHRPACEILETDAHQVFAALGLKDHLTPQRSNGFASMVARIKSDARAAVARN
jgi:cysteine desulfuration protein SufE